MVSVGAGGGGVAGVGPLRLPASLPGKESKRLTGILLPQPRVMTQEGERVLLDDVLGSGFALLRLYENPDEAFTALQGEQWERLGVRFVCIQPTLSARAPAHNTAANGTRTQPMIVIDIEQQLSVLLHYNRDLYVLVRPDRYIMGVFPVKHVNRLIL